MRGLRERKEREEKRARKNRGQGEVREEGKRGKKSLFYALTEETVIDSGREREKENKDG